MFDELVCAIRDASVHRAPQMLRTPLIHSAGLSELLGCRVLLKAEHLQTTGSFKYRGASNKVRTLSAAERKSGVITASSGNHGQALALAGRDAGVAVKVYASSDASPTKLDAIRRYGAALVLVDGTSLDAELAAKEDADRSGSRYVSPYNDLDVIAGQGTIGLELIEQTDDLDAVFLSVGGGGLAAGVGAALRANSASTRLVGCWPENSPALLRALELGHIHDVPETGTLSDGTAGGVEPDAVTLPLCRRVVDQRVAVSEDAIRQAMFAVAEHEHWMVEGAAGVALAGLMAVGDQWRDRTVAVVLCGRNIAAATFAAALTGAGRC